MAEDPIERGSGHLAGVGDEQRVLRPVTARVIAEAHSIQDHVPGAVRGDLALTDRVADIGPALLRVGLIVRSGLFVRAGFPRVVAALVLAGPDRQFAELVA